MRTLLFSLCVVALTPFPTFAEDKASNDNSNTHASQKQMDAIAIIKNDHKKITKMIDQLEKNMNSNIKQSRSTFENLKTVLENHETMEQKDWYPDLEKYDELKNIIDKLKKEEEAAGEQLKALDNMSDDKEWKTNVKKLIKDVKKHAKEEETQLFPKVKKVVDKSTLEKISEKMKENYKNDQKD